MNFNGKVTIQKKKEEKYVLSTDDTYIHIHTPDKWRFCPVFVMVSCCL